MKRDYKEMQDNQEEMGRKKDCTHVQNDHKTIKDEKKNTKRTNWTTRDTE